jgi:uncharacterized membrane protein
MSTLDQDPEVKFAKRLAIWIVGASLVVGAIVWVTKRGADTVDNGILHYEEFTEIAKACDKLNTDLCNMHKVPADDPMFAQFSKAQRVLALQSELNRWVEEYNGKSKMLNRSLWKPSSLPYQLSVSYYPCYDTK